MCVWILVWHSLASCRKPLCPIPPLILYFFKGRPSVTLRCLHIPRGTNNPTGINCPCREKLGYGALCRTQLYINSSLGQAMENVFIWKCHNVIPPCICPFSSICNTNYPVVYVGKRLRPGSKPSRVRQMTISLLKYFPHCLWSLHSW